MQFIGTGDRILTENFNVGYLYTITFKTGIYINSACIGIGDTFVMFQKAEPDLLFTLNVDTADEVDTIELYDSGGGTNNYDDLVNRPQINSHTLTGNMSASDLGLQDTISDLDTIRAGAAAGATAVQPAALSDYQPLISDLDTIRAGAAAGATAVQPADMTTALALKQDALNAAQLDAVNSGITSTDVEQIETNKNNISYNTAMGVKNLFDNVATASSGNRVSYTPNADKSGTITTESSGAAAPVYFDLGTVTLPSGTYVLSGGVSSDVSLRSSDNTYVDEGNGATITLPQSATISLRIRVASGYTNINGITVYPMIRNAIITNTTYQPYAMSNAELTAAIQAIQAQLANQ